MRFLLVLLLCIPLASGAQTLKRRFGSRLSMRLSTETTRFLTTRRIRLLVAFVYRHRRDSFDYSLTLGIRKIARFKYENRANVFYNGEEHSYSDAATIGTVKGFEFLFESDYRRQQECCT
ncbi:MAG: hypothetical protein CM15mV74_300 [uncultured marine virus]|nr:MAG: hypothetical protein CM15mV74_300 [uncultured marine virus]